MLGVFGLCIYGISEQIEENIHQECVIDPALRKGCGLDAVSRILLGLVSDGSMKFLNLTSQFQLNIQVITSKTCKGKLFFMLILSYCCCIMLSSYFYTSKQNGDIGHSPGPKNNWHKPAVFTSLHFLSPPDGAGHVQSACRE